MLSVWSLVYVSLYTACIVPVMYLDISVLWAVALLVTLQFEPVISDIAVGRG